MCCHSSHCTLLLSPHFRSCFLNIFFFCKECLPILCAPYFYSPIYKRTQLIAAMQTSLSWKDHVSCAVQNVLLISIFLGTNTFLIWATTFHVYVEYTLWCNSQMYIDVYNAYRNQFLYAVIFWYSGLLTYTRGRN